MQDDSRELPDTQIFRLKDAVIFVCSPEPEEPEPDPPRPGYNHDGVMPLMSLGPLVERVLRRCGVRTADVPDLLQTVLLEILEWWTKRGPAASAGAIRDARAFTAVVTRRTAYYHQRRRRRRESRERTGWADGPIPLEERAGVDVASEPSPEEAVLAAEAHRERVSELNLDELAAATAPAFWRAFYAHVVLNVPVAEIAESERVPTGTIYNRIHLAKEDLRAAICRRRARKRR
jgi:DNA-directed RNA polymerase specialized sigma24 family protein